MLAHSVPQNQAPVRPAPLVLLASPDAESTADLKCVFDELGLRVELVNDHDTAMAAIAELEEPVILLLDARLPEVANAQLLAAIHESGMRKRCAIALISEQISNEWVARLREGSIDNIVPRSSDAAAWNIHLNTMLRGHRLYCELEKLRDNAQFELQHDAVTGTFNRESMLSILFRETDRVQRLRGSLSVLVFAVDDFGQWMDELGQNACDGLLREVARRAGRALRSYDLLGMAGKVEFLLALPGCGTIDAVAMAERLRMEVFEEPFEVKSGSQGSRAIRKVRLTASFGITSSRGRSPVVVMREAESVLAQGKLTGSDQIRCAGELPLIAWQAIDVEFGDLFQDPELIG